MSDRAKHGTDALAEDFQELRAHVKQESKDAWMGVKMLARGAMRAAGIDNEKKRRSKDAD
jgi:hypothetical protein